MEQAAVAATNSMLVYILLHVLFGIIAAAVFVHIRNAPGHTRKKGWFGNFIGVVSCLAIAALIGELSKRWLVEDIYKFIGAGAVLLSFLGTVSIGGLRNNQKREPK